MATSPEHNEQLQGLQDQLTAERALREQAIEQLTQTQERLDAREVQLREMLDEVAADRADNQRMLDTLTVLNEADDERQPAAACAEDAPTTRVIPVAAAAGGTTPPPRQPRTATASPDRRPNRGNERLRGGRVGKALGVLAVGAALFGAYMLGHETNNHGKAERTELVAKKTSKAHAASTSAKSNGNGNSFVNGNLGSFPDGHSKDAANAANANKTPVAPYGVAAAGAPHGAAPLSKHEGYRQNADDAKTVAGTVAKLHVTAKTTRGDIKFLSSSQHAADKLDHRSSTDAMNSMLQFDKFSHGQKLDANKLAVAMADGSFSSVGYGTAVYNAMHNLDPSTNALPQGVSFNHAKQAIEKFMIAKGTTFSIETPEGTFMNHGQHGESVYNAGVVNLDGKGEQVLIIKGHDGAKLYFKLFAGPGGKLCVNLLTPLEKVTTPHGHNQTTPTHPGGPKRTPPAHQGPKKPTGGNDQGPNHGKPVTHPHPKNDPNQTPAGVPGEPRGSGGDGLNNGDPQPGVAPPGVGQPQLPTPAPEVPQNNEQLPPQNQVETGTDPNPTTNANQNDAGANTNAGQINAGTTPVAP